MSQEVQELDEDEAALWFASLPDSTHYAGCWRYHAGCAYALASDRYWPSVRHPAHASALSRARSLAMLLEEELAETQRRCQQLISEWTRTGSMAHAAQLAEALDLGADL